MAAKRSDAYETFTHDLLQLADSLGDRGLTHVAMESAGVYWSRCGTFSGSSFRCCSRTRNPSTPRPAGRRTGKAASGPLVASRLRNRRRELRDLTRYRAFGAEDELLSRIGFRKFSRAPTPTWRQLATDALGASGERSWKRCSPRSKTLRGSPEMSKGLLLDMIARLQLAVERPMPERRRFLRRTAARSSVLRGIGTERDWARDRPTYAAFSGWGDSGSAPFLESTK